MNLEVSFTEEFKSIVQKKAEELISSGKTEGNVSDSFYGNLRIFVGSKPASVLFSAQIDGNDIYVGGEQE